MKDENTKLQKLVDQKTAELVDKQADQERAISRLQRDADGWKSLFDKVYEEKKVLSKTKSELSLELARETRALSLQRESLDRQIKLTKEEQSKSIQMGTVVKFLENVNNEKEVVIKDLQQKLKAADQEMEKTEGIVAKINSETDSLILLNADEIKSLKQEIEFQKKRHLSNAVINEKQQSLDQKEEKIKLLLSEKEESVNALFGQTAQMVAMKKAVKTNIECIDRLVRDCLAHDKEVLEHSFERMANLVKNSQKTNQEVTADADGTNFKSTFSSFVEAAAGAFKSVEGESELVPEPTGNSEHLIKKMESESDIDFEKGKVKLEEEIKDTFDVSFLHQHNDRITMITKSHSLEMDSVTGKMENKICQLETLFKGEAEAVRTELEGRHDMYKKAAEVEMNKKAHLVEKVKGDLKNVIQTVSRKDAEILKIQTEQETLKTDLESALVEKDTVAKELSDLLSRKEAEIKIISSEFQSMKNNLEAKVTEKEIQVQNLQVNMLFINLQ